MSRAVRAGVVTGMPPIVWISSPTSRSDHVWMPSGGRRYGYSSWAGARSSIHFVPYRAAADLPATTPRRRDHNQADRARSPADSAVPAGTYTSGWTLTNRLRSAYGVTRPDATASLPMKGSAMAGVCRGTPTSVPSVH